MRMQPYVLGLALAAACMGNSAGSSAQAAPAGVSATGADAVERGRAHFTRGVEFFREGNFPAALIEFRRANEAAPNYRISYNLGQTYFELRDYGSALQSFEEYLAKGAGDIPAQRRSDVEGEIRKLRGRVAVVTVRSNVDGGEVLVDDVVVGTLPLREPLMLSAGRHRMAVRKGGVEKSSVVVELAGGDATTADLTVSAGPAAAPIPVVPAPSSSISSPVPAVPVSPPAVQPTGMGTGFWVGLAATGVFATGAVVTGLMTLGAKSDFNGQLETYPNTRSAVDDSRDKTKRLALFTDVLGGAAVVAGAFTVYFAVSGPSGEARPASRVGLRVGPSAVLLDGSF